MTLQEVMSELAAFGNESTKKILMKHGAKEPFFGVKVQDLKKLQKKIKKNHELSLELYATGNGDAMYLAGLIADDQLMNRKILDNWAQNAHWHMISEYTVPWIAADSGHAWECGLAWIDKKQENVASSGWSALSSHLSVCDNSTVDSSVVRQLLQRIATELQDSGNRVRYTMNGFIIAVGCYLPNLKEDAEKAAASVGKVQVNMGDTACKVPDALTYIAKVAKAGRTGKKRKMARC